MLIQCPECGRSAVSDNAACCPRCGIPRPGNLFWENRRRPYEEAAQKILNSRKLWIKFVGRPCACQRYGGEGNDVVGRAVEAKAVRSSEGALYSSWEDYLGHYRYSWNGRGPEYYVEFVIECEICKIQWLGALSYGDWSYYEYSIYGLRITDGPKRPAPNAHNIVFSVKLLQWGYEPEWSRQKTWVWRALTLSSPLW